MAFSIAFSIGGTKKWASGMASGNHGGGIFPAELYNIKNQKIDGLIFKSFLFKRNYVCGRGTNGIFIDFFSEFPQHTTHPINMFTSETTVIIPGQCAGSFEGPYFFETQPGPRINLNHQLASRSFWEDFLILN